MKISVITTTLNSEKYLKQTIASIKLNLKGHDVEHIIVDAGSSDKTIQIAEQEGISKCYELKNSTMYEAIDYGFKRSSGNFLCWLNSDDEFLTDTFNSWEYAFKKNENVKIVTGGVKYINEKGKFLYNYNWPLTYYTFIKSFKTLMICQPSTCWKREVYFDIGGFNLDYKITADRDFFLRAIKNFGISRISKDLCRFRIHGNNLSRTKKELAILEDIMINKKLDVGPTTLKRKLIHIIGHMVTKFFNPSMIIWKLKNHQGNLFHGNS